MNHWLNMGLLKGSLFCGDTDMFQNSYNKNQQKAALCSKTK